MIDHFKCCQSPLFQETNAWQFNRAILPDELWTGLSELVLS
jgi:hypothetical protein